jgi:hypothetical protein
MPYLSTIGMSGTRKGSMGLRAGRAWCARCKRGSRCLQPRWNRARWAGQEQGRGRERPRVRPPRRPAMAAGSALPPGSLPPSPDMWTHPARDMSNSWLRRSLRDVSVDRDSRKRDDDETMRRPTDE